MSRKHTDGPAAPQRNTGRYTCMPGRIRKQLSYYRSWYSGEKGAMAMTTVHAEIIGDKALVPRSELERLLEIARRSEPIQVEVNGPALLTQGIMELADAGGAFDWLADEEDLYDLTDLKVRYR
jgi:hypothetical protein